MNYHVRANRLREVAIIQGRGVSIPLNGSLVNDFIDVIGRDAGLYGSSSDIEDLPSELIAQDSNDMSCRIGHNNLRSRVPENS